MQRFAQVNWIRKVQYCVSEYDHFLFVFANEGTRERLILDLGYNAVSNPLPELGLRCPVFTAIATNNTRTLLFLLFLFLFNTCHFQPFRLNTLRRPVHVAELKLPV